MRLIPIQLSLLLLSIGLLTACSVGSDSGLPTLAQLSADANPSPSLEDSAVSLLDYWVTESGILSPSKTRDIWQFVGRRGDTITLRVIGYNIQPEIVLQDTAGRVLMQGTGFQSQLDEDGVYTVQVVLNQTGDGSYEIGLGYADRPNPNNYTPTPRPQLVGVPTPTPPFADIGVYVANLDDSAPTGSILSPTQDKHVYSLQGKAGDLINVTMERVAGELDPYLALYSPAGDLLAIDGNSGSARNAELRNIKLGVDGVYSLQVTGGGTVGTYSLVMIRGGRAYAAETAQSEQASPTPVLATPTIGPALNGNRLEDHAPVFGSLEAGSFAQYSVYAVAGEIFTLGVMPRGDNPLRAQIEMYSPEGELVAYTNATQSNDSGNTIIPAFTAPITGAYIIILNGENGTGGDYFIAYGTGYSNETIYRGEPAPNTRTDSTISRQGVQDEWRISLKKGDIVTLAASTTSGIFDPYLELFTFDGQLVAGDNNSGGGTAALIQSAQINESGIFRIIVRHATQQLNRGSYTLIWRYINVAPTPTAIPAYATLMSLDDNIEEGRYQFYVFSGQAGQRIRIRVEAKPGESLDPVAVLLNPSAEEVAQGDDSNGTLNPLIEYTLPADGTYTVRVNGYLSSGAFDLFVEQLF